MTSFSWTDTLHIAFNTCLPCFHRSESTDSLVNRHQSAQRTRPAPHVTGSTPDEETLSLHTNPGLSPRNKKQKKASTATHSERRITLFGYDLFGRPAEPPIHLPDNDDALYHHHPPPPITPTLTFQSTATFDSDATPLDPSTIDSLSGSAVAALAETEEEERRQREERRKQRKERRELKKVARALALSGSGEFEGFQGSGDGYPAIPSPYLQEHRIQAQSRFQQSPSPTTLLPHLALQEGEDDESADLDGMVYNRRRPIGHGSNDGGSDSRSRTSASTSDRPNAFVSHRQAAEYRPKSIRPQSSSARTKSNKPKSVSSNNSSNRGPKSSRSSNPDSTPIASPVSLSFFPEGEDRSIANTATLISPSTVEQGQGFFDLEDEPQVRVPAVQYIKSPDETATASLERRGFPSAGFGVGFGRARGAFLANTNGIATAGKKNRIDDHLDGFY